MAQTIILFKQMIVMFSMASIGLIAFKKGLLDDASCKKLSGLIVNICNPALILSSAINRDGSIRPQDMYAAFIGGIVLYSLLVLTAVVWPVLLRAPRNKWGTYKVMMIFTNIGFMGFPIMEAAFGSNSLLLGNMFLFSFNVLIYTYGVRCLQKEGDTPDQTEGKAKWKLILNNGVIACVIAFILFMGDIPVPDVLQQTVSKFSSITAPLSMLVIGASFATLKIKELFSDIRLFAFAAIKLLFLPIVGTVLFAVGLHGIGVDLHQTTVALFINVVMMLLATPTGSMTVMLAQQSGGDVKLTSKAVALTTLLSVLTIPTVSVIVNMVMEQL